MELINEFGGDAVRDVLDQVSPIGAEEADLVEGSPVSPEGEPLPEDLGPASYFGDDRFDHSPFSPLST